MKREGWIDIMKSLAILAVVFDHASFIYPKFQNVYLWQHSFFSITWFVFLSAVTNTLSSMKKTSPPLVFILLFWLKRALAIIIPYVLATLVIYTYYNYPKMNARHILTEIVNFSAQPTYYFINLLLELYLLFPFLYILVSKIKNKYWFIPITLVVYIVSERLFMRRIQIWPFYSMGMIFGGYYFFVFWLGILYAKKIFQENAIVIAILAAVFIYYEIIINTTSVFLIRSTDIHLILWAVSLLFLVKKGIELLPLKNAIGTYLSVLGRYSIFIYLWHYFFLSSASRYSIDNPMKFMGVFALSVLFSLMIGYIYTRVSYFLTHRPG